LSADSGREIRGKTEKEQRNAAHLLADYQTAELDKLDTYKKGKNSDETTIKL
jgi:hypothetical protein